MFFGLALLVWIFYPKRALLIQSAIEYSYSSIYTDLSDLRKDYPGFTPRIRRWSPILVFLFGQGLYAVQMPEEEVLITSEGEAKTSRTCGGVGADCQLVAPRDRKLGVVGTVQLGAPDYLPSNNIEVSWNGTPGYVQVVGHCFSAFKSSEEPLSLLINVPGYKPIVIENVYGYRLVAVTVDSRINSYNTMRIPESMFNESKTCSEKARAEWPNVGGWAWKR